MRKRDNSRNYLQWWKVAGAFLLLLIAGALLFQVLQQEGAGPWIWGRAQGGGGLQEISRETWETWFFWLGRSWHPGYWVLALLLGSLWQLGEIFGLWWLVL